MTTKRQIEAYDCRLAKVTTAIQLTPEMLGTEITYYDAGHGKETTAFLVGFRHYFDAGLFNFRVRTDLELAESSKAFAQSRSAVRTVADVIGVSVSRSDDNAKEESA